jgi:hypothetical protein
MDMDKKRGRLFLILLVVVPLVHGTDDVSRALPTDTCARYERDLLKGETLRYGLYGKKPIRWLENGSGDEMLRRFNEGEFPDDDSFKHTSFIYGSYWDNCRRYYMAYRVTGDRRHVEQLRQYVRLMDRILAKRPWLVLPQEQRQPRPTDPVVAIPHEPAAASNFIGHVLAARLTLQMARADRASISDVQLAETRAFLATVVRYMDALVKGGSAIDDKLSIPASSAKVVNTVPYNQSFMMYAVLGLAAVALEDEQALGGHRKHEATIGLYAKITRAGLSKFFDHSDVTTIEGKLYLFHSHSPADRYEQVKDPKTGRRVAQIVDGHPIFHYPEDVPHSQSQAWNLALLWETDGKRFGVTENHLRGLANAHVDYVLRGKAPLREGGEGPAMHILSPWTLKYRPKVKWKRLGKPALVYAIYLPWRSDIAQATRDLNGRGRKEMAGAKGRGFVDFAHYLAARRKQSALLHLPIP